MKKSELISLIQEVINEGNVSSDHNWTEYEIMKLIANVYFNYEQDEIDYEECESLAKKDIKKFLRTGKLY